MSIRRIVKCKHGKQLCPVCYTVDRAMMDIGRAVERVKEKLSMDIHNKLLEAFLNGYYNSRG